MSPLSNARLLPNHAMATQLDPTSSATALTEFKLFPKLPTELRLKVFEYAIPTSKKGEKRVIRVIPFMEGSLPYDFKVTFKILKKSGEGQVRGTLTSTEIYDIGLLRACKECRQAFLKAFENCPSLSTIDGGIIRFHQDTYIYLQELLSRFTIFDGFVTAMRTLGALNSSSTTSTSSPVFNGIKRLALDGQSWELLWSCDLHIHLIRLFEGLAVDMVDADFPLHDILGRSFRSEVLLQKLRRDIDKCKEAFGSNFRDFRVENLELNCFYFGVKELSRWYMIFRGRDNETGGFLLGGAGSERYQELHVYDNNRPFGSLQAVLQIALLCLSCCSISCSDLSNLTCHYYVMALKVLLRIFITMM